MSGLDAGNVYPLLTQQTNLMIISVCVSVLQLCIEEGENTYTFGHYLSKGEQQWLATELSAFINMRRSNRNK